MKGRAVSFMSSGIEGKGWDVLDPQDRMRFEQLVLPHLDAAFNLSRWLLRRRGGRRTGIHAARVSFFSRVSWRRCASLAFANCTQHLLHVAGEKSSRGFDHRIR